MRAFFARPFGTKEGIDFDEVERALIRPALLRLRDQHDIAIEGGTNRTSGIQVDGVGAANREQIEKIFYRAFTELLPASANFAASRSLSSRNGSSSAAET